MHTLLCEYLDFVYSCQRYYFNTKSHALLGWLPLLPNTYPVRAKNYLNTRCLFS